MSQAFTGHRVLYRDQIVSQRLLLSLLLLEDTEEFSVTVGQLMGAFAIYDQDNTIVYEGNRSLSITDPLKMKLMISVDPVATEPYQLEKDKVNIVPYIQQIQDNPDYKSWIGFLIKIESLGGWWSYLNTANPERFEGQYVVEHPVSGFINCGVSYTRVE